MKREFVEILLTLAMVAGLLWGADALGCQESNPCVPLTPPESLYHPHGTVVCPGR